MTINGVSKKFKRMCEVYAIFARHWELDFSDEMKIEMFNAESFGGRVSPNSGFAVGKSQLNLNTTMWLEDIELGLLRSYEIYEEKLFPEWWLNRIFKDKGVKR